MHLRFFTTPRPVVWIAAVALVAMLPPYAADVARTFHIDFVAFWCAGAAVAQHRDPYLDVSLHACDVAQGLIPTLTLPVAHPPYVLPLFAALSYVPVQVAYPLWVLVSLICCVLSGTALCRLTNLHWTFVGAVVALTVAIPSLPLGQLVPLAFCAFCWSLVYLREGRAKPAAGALAVAAILPNVAGTAWISAFVSDKRTRVPLIVAGALLLAVGAAAVGLAGLLFYFRVVLGAYGRSELDAFWQLGSAATLHSLGVPQNIALGVSYGLLACLLVLGIVTGMKLRDRFGGNHWVVAATAAFGLLGAPYAHLTDVAFAVPLALLLLDAAPAPFAAAATMAIATPWQHLFQNTQIQAAICIPFLLVVAATLFENTLRSAALVAAISAGSLLLYRFADAAAIQMRAAASLSNNALAPDALAEVRWTQFAHLARSIPDAALMRIPLYLAVGAVLYVALRCVGASPATPRSRTP